MSWQAYVDNNLVGSGQFYQAAILGQQGGVWATSAGLNILPQEQTKIVNAHANKSDTESSGILIANEKYFTLSVDDRTIRLRHSGRERKADGAIIVKTKQAVLVGLYKAPAQAQEASKVIEALAEYLIGANY